MTKLLLIIGNNPCQQGRVRLNGFRYAYVIVIKLFGYRIVCARKASRSDEKAFHLKRHALVDRVTDYIQPDEEVIPIRIL